MKKYLLGLLLCTSTAYAWVDLNVNCEHLKITLYNDTPETCLLVSKGLKAGAINLHSSIPIRIGSGTSTPLIIIDELLAATRWQSRGTELLLTYQCGETRQITLRSQKQACILGGDTQAQILSASNMNATYDVTPTDYWSSQPGEINWILY